MHYERLEKVLGYLFWAEPDSNLNSSLATREVLEELLGGWVYGSREAPGSLSRAWHAAQRDVTERHSGAVPWELLSVLTLTIEGTIKNSRLSLLQDAWHRGELAGTFLTDFVAWRIYSCDEFSRWELLESGKAGSSAEKTHQERYEEGLAVFIRWLCRLASSEAVSSEERCRLVEKLPARLQGWIAAHRNHPHLRKPLLQAYGAVVALAPERLGAALQNLARADLSPGSEGLAELAALLPEFDQWWFNWDFKFVGRLLQRVPVDGAERVSFSVRQWLLRWCRHCTPPKAAAKELGRLFGGWLLEDSVSGSLGWLSIAAEIQRQPTLRSWVETVVRKKHVDHPKTLYLFVKYTLTSILKNQERLHRLHTVAEGTGYEDYASKVAAYHAYFVPFADTIDAEFLDEVLRTVDSEQTFIREGTTKFLAALLLKAPKDLHQERSEGWRKDLERLITSGATGEGALGPLVALLPSSVIEKLQDNVIAVAASGSDRGDHHPVQWIVTTLTGASPDSLPALEEQLVELTGSPSLTVAQASLEGILGPIREKLPGFLPRNRRRLRRVKAVIEARGGYRPTSKYAARLGELGKMLDEPA